MTVVLLVRHAEHVLQERAVLGRTDGAAFSDKGLEQLRQLSEVLAGEPVAAIQSSPRVRALKTAEAIAAPHGIKVDIHPALDELDYGEWSGLTFEALRDCPEWRSWNNRRSKCCPPHGETMLALQERMLRHLSGLRDENIGKTIVIVSHAEPIRAVLMHEVGLSLDEYGKVDIPPAAIARLNLSQRAAWAPDTLKAIFA